MAHSLQNLFSNFNLYYGKFYNYMLYGLYYGLVPTVIVYGKIQLSKQKQYRCLCQASQSHIDSILELVDRQRRGWPLWRSSSGTIRRRSRLLLRDINRDWWLIGKTLNYNSRYLPCRRLHERVILIPFLFFISSLCVVIFAFFWRHFLLLEVGVSLHRWFSLSRLLHIYKSNLLVLLPLSFCSSWASPSPDIS